MEGIKKVCSIEILCNEHLVIHVSPNDAEGRYGLVTYRNNQGGSGENHRGSVTRKFSFPSFLNK